MFPPCEAVSDSFVYVGSHQGSYYKVKQWNDGYQACYTHRTFHVLACLIKVWCTLKGCLGQNLFS